MTDADARRGAVLDALRAVIDPDLSQDIVSLGFVQGLRIEGGAVRFDVQLTTPACPVKDDLQRQCEEVVAALSWVETVEVTMTADTRGRSRAVDDAHEALAGVKNLVGIASGKGGVGKSTTTVQLAHSLAAAGASVGLLDADVQGPSLQHMTGAGIPEDKVGDRLVPPTVDGVKVLSMAMFLPPGRPAVLRGPRVTNVIQQFLTAFHWGELDYLLIDYPPGTGDIQITLAQLVPLTGAVLVTTPQEVALLDVRKAAAMFDMLEVPVLGVVETMSGFECPDCGSLHRVFAEGGGEATAEGLGVPLLGRIPLDPHLVLGGDAGRPTLLTHPEAPSSRAFRAAAGELARAVSVQHAERGEALDSFHLSWASGAPSGAEPHP